eukprot:scaffold10239_cov122-Isochrysis_galbana.AAC.5
MHSMYTQRARGNCVVPGARSRPVARGPVLQPVAFGVASSQRQRATARAPRPAAIVERARQAMARDRVSRNRGTSHALTA